MLCSSHVSTCTSQPTQPTHCTCTWQRHSVTQCFHTLPSKKKISLNRDKSIPGYARKKLSVKSTIFHVFCMPKKRAMATFIYVVCYAREILQILWRSTSIQCLTDNWWPWTIDDACCRGVASLPLLEPESSLKGCEPNGCIQAKLRQIFEAVDVNSHVASTVDVFFCSNLGSNLWNQTKTCLFVRTSD